MSKIIFIYINNKYEFILNEEQTFNKAFLEFSRLIDNNLKDLLFFYKGKNISLNNNIINSQTKNNIIISVFNLRKIVNNNEIPYIVCPECKNLAFLNVNNDKINIDNCINKHKNIDLTINDFIKSQINDELNIKCDICKNNKYLYGENFYICSCHKYLCQLCIGKHRLNNHIIFNFDKRFNICNKHSLYYVSYCSLCNINMCQKCEEEHINHKNKILFFKKEKPKAKRINEIKSEITDNINILNIYKDQLFKLNDLFNNFIILLIKKIELNIKLLRKIFLSLDNLNNYESFKNLLNYKNESLIKEANYFLAENIINKLKFLIDKYEISKNEMTLVYNIKKGDNRIKLFDKRFVNNNKDNCFLIIDNKLIDIFEDCDINNNITNFNNITVQLLEKKTVTDMSYLFSSCNSLSPESDFSKWNTNAVNKMNNMFFYCNLLTSLPDITKINTSNVTDFSYIFCQCNSLTSLPDISNWNINNTININYMFYGCNLLLSLPDISKWNIKKVKYMNNIFGSCNSLKYLPNISKWNMGDVIDISNMFSDCRSLLSIPDISKWNLKNITKINAIFYNCSSLKSLPDISNWDLNNIKELSYMFYGCKSLISLPDISKWNIDNIIDISYMFYNCSSLVSIPDISIWNTKNIIDMDNIFCDCNSLKSLPELSKWNISNVNNLSYMFSGCKGLLSLPNISKWNTESVKDMSYMFNGCKSLSSLPNIINWNLSNKPNMEHMFTNTIQI